MVTRAVEIDQRQAAFVDLPEKGVDGHRQFGHAANAQAQAARGHHRLREVVCRAPDRVGVDDHIAAFGPLGQLLRQARRVGRGHHAGQHHLATGAQDDIAAATADQRTGRLAQVAARREHDVAAAHARLDVAGAQVGLQHEIARIGHRAIVGSHHAGHQRNAAAAGTDAHATVDRRVRQHRDRPLRLYRHATGVTGAQARRLQVVQRCGQPGGRHACKSHVVEWTDLQRPRHRQADVTGGGGGGHASDVGAQRPIDAAHTRAGVDAQLGRRHGADGTGGRQRAGNRAPRHQRQVLPGHHLGERQTTFCRQADVTATAVHPRPDRRLGSGIDLHGQAFQARLQVDAAALGHDGCAGGQHQRPASLQGRRARHRGQRRIRRICAQQAHLDARPQTQTARRLHQQVRAAKDLHVPVDDQVTRGRDHTDRATAGEAGRLIGSATGQALSLQRR